MPTLAPNSICRNTCVIFISYHCLMPTTKTLFTTKLQTSHLVALQSAKVNDRRSLTERNCYSYFLQAKNFANQVRRSTAAMSIAIDLQLKLLNSKIETLTDIINSNSNNISSLHNTQKKLQQNLSHLTKTFGLGSGLLVSVFFSKISWMLYFTNKKHVKWLSLGSCLIAICYCLFWLKGICLFSFIPFLSTLMPIFTDWYLYLILKRNLSRQDMKLSSMLSILSWLSAVLLPCILYLQPVVDKQKC